MAATAPAAAEAVRSSATLLFEACVSARHRVTPEIVRYVANKIYHDMTGMQALPPLAGQISDKTGKAPQKWLLFARGHGFLKTTAACLVGRYGTQASYIALRLILTWDRSGRYLDQDTEVRRAPSAKGVWHATD
jgi:hypothetical protein